MKCFDSVEAYKKQGKLLDEVIKGPIRILDSSPAVKALGYNDLATIQWLWKKANPRSHWDPETIPIDRSQIGRFNDYVKTFVKSVGKGKDPFSIWFKLPKALARWFPQGDTFVNQVIETTAYNQRHVKEASEYIGAMTKGLYKMLGEYSDANLSKKDLDAVRGIEARFQSAKTKAERDAVINDLNNKVGNIGDRDAPALGKILRRFVGLLSGVNEGKPLEPANPTEEAIVRNWNTYRTAAMKDLLAGSINAKRLIKFLNDGKARSRLNDAIDRVQQQIDALLIQSNIDSKIWTKDYIVKEGHVIEKDGLKIFNPETGKKENYMMTDPKDPTKKVVAAGIQRYNPRYVLELTDMLSDIINKAKNYRDSSERNIDKMSVDELVGEIEKATNPTAISNRLKQKGETNKYFSLDPIFYLNKYANDVSAFNTSTRIDLLFAQHTKDLLKRIRKANMSNKLPEGDNDMGVYTNQLLDMMFTIRENALNQGRDQQGSFDQMTRMINAVEYVSKMGFGIKSAAKNMTQWLWNFHEYGLRGLAKSSQFFNKSSREWDPNDPKDASMTNQQMYQRQLKRMGLMIGDKAAAASVSTATDGSLDVLFVPKGFDIDPKTGSLVISSSQSGAKQLLNESNRFFSAVAEYASKRTIPGAVAEGVGETITRIATQGKAGVKDVMPGADNFLSIGSVAWSENVNRLQTFKIGFANAFEIESSTSRKEYHRRQIIKEKGEDHVVTNKELYDRIEYTAGNIAREMVSMFHYDYDNWSKSRILRSKTGRVLGQYQHFTFAYFDMMHQYITSARDDLIGGLKQAGKGQMPTRWFDKDEASGKYFNLNPNQFGDLKINPLSHNMQRLMRVAMSHTLLPGVVGAAFGLDIGGFWSQTGTAPFFATDEDKARMKRRGATASPLLEDPVVTKAKQFYDWFASDYEYDDKLTYAQNMKRKEQYQEQKHGAFYGKNPLVGNMGPFVSDILTFADLMDWYNQTPEEYERKKNMAMDFDDPDWRYNMARIFNVELARGYYRILPQMLEGDIGGVFRQQFGLYNPPWMQTWRKQNAEKVHKTMVDYNWLPPSKRKKKKLSSNKERILREREREDALKALSMIKF